MKKLLLSNWILCFSNQLRRVFCVFSALIFMNFLGCSEQREKTIEYTNKYLSNLPDSPLVAGASGTIIIQTNPIVDGMIQSIHVNKATTSKDYDYAHDFRLDDYQRRTFHNEITLYLQIPYSVEEGRYVITIEIVASKDISQRVRLYRDIMVVKKSQLENKQHIQKSSIEQGVFQKGQSDFGANTFSEKFFDSFKSFHETPFFSRKPKVPQGYNIPMAPLQIGLSKLKGATISFSNNVQAFYGTICDISITKEADSDNKNYSDAFGISHYKNLPFDQSTKICFRPIHHVDIATYILTITVLNDQGQKNIFHIPLHIYSDAQEKRQQEEEQRYKREAYAEEQRKVQEQRKAKEKIQWLQELGFAPNDTPNETEINTAYRKLARIHHPDKVLPQFSELTGEALKQKEQEVKEKFQTLNNAHKELLKIYGKQTEAI